MHLQAPHGAKVRCIRGDSQELDRGNIDNYHDQDFADKQRGRALRPTVATIHTEDVSRTAPRCVVEAGTRGVRLVLLGDGEGGHGNASKDGREGSEELHFN